MEKEREGKGRVREGKGRKGRMDRGIPVKNGREGRVREGG